MKDLQSTEPPTDTILASTKKIQGKDITAQAALFD